LSARLLYLYRSFYSLSVSWNVIATFKNFSSKTKRKWNNVSISISNIYQHHQFCVQYLSTSGSFVSGTPWSFFCVYIHCSTDWKIIKELDFVVLFGFNLCLILRLSGKKSALKISIVKFSFYFVCGININCSAPMLFSFVYFRRKTHDFVRLHATYCLFLEC